MRAMRRFAGEKYEEARHAHTIEEPQGRSAVDASGTLTKVNHLVSNWDH